MSWSEHLKTPLENEHLLLRPVHESDRGVLRELCRDSAIWEYFTSRADSDSEFESFFNTMLKDQSDKTRAVYIIVDKASEQIAGSMSFGNLVEKEHRLEIGWSWLGKEYRGRGINHWAKFLLMQQAFEVLGAKRVEFKTDILNLRARAALKKIGATEEGVMRSFNYMPSGRRRDAIYYSVLSDEWTAVKQQLEA